MSAFARRHRHRLAFEGVRAGRPKPVGPATGIGFALARQLVAWAGVVALALPAPACAEPITLRDDRGTTVVLPAVPTRIVSLLPSLTESICALGACTSLVGTDRYSDFPASVIALPKLGGIDDAQVERIVALRPDVVLAAAGARVTDRLESLGIRVLVLESRTRAEVQRSLVLLAAMIRQPAAADALLAAIAREIRLAADRVPPQLRGQRVYFEVDATPYAAGAGSFIGETLSALGMANAVPAELGPFPRLNPEFIVRAQPDIIIAGQRELGVMGDRPGWASLRALRHHRTCGFPSARYEVLIRPGPRLGEAAALLADCFAALGRLP